MFKGSGFYITDYGKDGKGPRKEPAEKSDRSEKADKPAAAAKPAADAKPTVKDNAPAKKAAE